MPPCAAMEWARRGLSWKQKACTLQPSSASVAAAEPPASPVPTMMMLYFRLLAGFTSFISNLCLSHRFSIGPAGTLPSSSIRSHLSRTGHGGLRADQVRHRGDRNRKMPDGDDDGKHGCELLQQRRVARMADAQRLKHAPQPVIEVHCQKQHRDDVEDRDPRMLEAHDHVVIGV